MSLFRDFINRMYSLTHRRHLPTLGMWLFLSHLALSQDAPPRGDSLEILNALPIKLTKVFHFKIPPRPSGHVLDTAHFLTPEMLQSLEASLSREAKDYGVEIYLLTMPSVEKNTLEPFTQAVADEWTKGLFGATLVFDDGTGLVSIEQSAVVKKRFYEFELSRLLRDTASSAKRPKLSRAGLEHTTMAVKGALHEFKMRANREDRNALLTRVGVCVVGILAVIVGGIEYIRKRPASTLKV